MDQSTFNLLDLRNRVTAILSQVELPAGYYDLLRLYVREANVVLQDTTFDLNIPSAASSGLKVFIRPAIEITGGVTTELLLDFDVSKSFHVEGNPAAPSGFRFYPVVRGVNLATAGRLQGTVKNISEVAIPGAQVSVSNLDSVLATTFTDSAGAYAFIGIPVDTYTMEAYASGYNSETVSGVAVDAKGTKIQNFTLTSQ